LETFLKGEALITEFDIRIGETIASVFNQGKEVPIASLKSFLQSWKEDYHEDTVLFESFSKFIHKVMKKFNADITSEEQREWTNKLFRLEDLCRLDNYEA
jgi:hypothetical protein